MRVIYVTLLHKAQKSLNPIKKIIVPCLFYSRSLNVWSCEKYTFLFWKLHANNTLQCGRGWNYPHYNLYLTACIGHTCWYHTVKSHRKIWRVFSKMFSKWKYFCQNGRIRRIVRPFCIKIFSFWNLSFSHDFCQCRWLE